MKKKRILVCFFLALIALTAICTIVSAVRSYQFDRDPANGVDSMEGMGAAMLLVLGGFVILYELDLFYTVYYFLIKPKTPVRSVLNLFSNVSLLLVFISLPIANALSIHEETAVTVTVFLLYLLLRGIYLTVSTLSQEKEE